MTPDTKHGASFGAASSTAELAEALRHIDKSITSPRENATLGAAADRLLKLERECNEERRAYLGASNHRDALQEKLEAGDAYAVQMQGLLRRVLRAWDDDADPREGDPFQLREEAYAALRAHEADFQRRHPHHGGVGNGALLSDSSGPLNAAPSEGVSGATNSDEQLTMELQSAARNVIESYSMTDVVRSGPLFIDIGRLAAVVTAMQVRGS